MQVAASAMFDSAVSVDPSRPVLHIWRGRHFLRVGNLAAALRAFQIATALNPYVAEGWYWQVCSRSVLC
jgi:predicted Zn-dependent protease